MYSIHRMSVLHFFLFILLVLTKPVLQHAFTFIDLALMIIGLRC